MAQDRQAVERIHSDVVERHGRWLAHNVDLGHGVFTIGEGAGGVAADRIARIAQIVSDLVGPNLEGLRILDLGALEGGFSIELAKRGATVTAIEGREAHAARAAAAKDALGLDGMTVHHGDVRELRRLVDGQFDVVLCLGLLYHLDTPDAFELIEDVSAVCGRLALVETQVSLNRREQRDWRGEEYWGMTYREPAAAFASVGNRESFWFTRPSLINLLQASGFTSVSECLTPAVEEILAFEDHVTLAAVKGEPIAEGQAWPEQVAWSAHPAQGLGARLRERLSGKRRRRFRGIFSPGGD